MNVIILHSHIISKRRAFIILELLGYKNIANVILTGKIQGQTSQVPEVAMDPRKNKSFKFKGFNGLEEQENGGRRVHIRSRQVSCEYQIFMHSGQRNYNEKRQIILFVKLIRNKNIIFLFYPNSFKYIVPQELCNWIIVD